ncbi:hypothetical protein D3C75_1271790 [compost metagenome]
MKNDGRASPFSRRDQVQGAGHGVAGQNQNVGLEVGDEGLGCWGSDPALFMRQNLQVDASVIDLLLQGLDEADHLRRP